MLHSLDLYLIGKHLDQLGITTSFLRILKYPNRIGLRLPKSSLGLEMFNTVSIWNAVRPRALVRAANNAMARLNGENTVFSFNCSFYHNEIGKAYVLFPLISINAGLHVQLVSNKAEGRHNLHFAFCEERRSAPEFIGKSHFRRTLISAPENAEVLCETFRIALCWYASYSFIVAFSRLP